MTLPVCVVVADDSPFVCRLLTAYLRSLSDIQAVGIAPNGLRAIELVEKLQPDVLTLDLVTVHSPLVLKRLKSPLSG